MLNQLIKLIKNKKYKSGFTLIEMLVVLVVVALLMAIIIPNVSGQRQKINEKAQENITEIITTQAETYQLVEGDTSGNISLDTLHTNGYITEKQMEEALNYFEGGIVVKP